MCLKDIYDTAKSYRPPEYIYGVVNQAFYGFGKSSLEIQELAIFFSEICNCVIFIGLYPEPLIVFALGDLDLIGSIPIGFVLIGLLLISL